MPRGFKFPIDYELWRPAEPGTDQMSGWGFGFGRLKPSVTIAEARTELNLIEARLAASRSLESKPQPILVGAFTRYLSDLKGLTGRDPAYLPCCWSRCWFCSLPAPM